MFDCDEKTQKPFQMSKADDTHKPTTQDLGRAVKVKTNWYFCEQSTIVYAHPPPAPPKNNNNKKQENVGIFSKSAN